MVRVLITGGAGYVGSHTAKALHQEGIIPVVYDNLSNGKDHFVRWGPLINGSVNNYENLISSLKKIDAVIHMAGRIEVGQSIKDPAITYQENLIGSLTLLNAMRYVGVRSIIFSSSAAVYGNPQQIPILEDHPLNPINPYGATKLATERAIQWYADAYNMSYVCLRYFNACGADPNREIGENHKPETHLIPIILQAGLNNNLVNIFGNDYPTHDGTAIRDYVHVSDIAQAHVLSLKRLLNNKDSLIANLGTGQGYSVRQILDKSSEILGKKIDYQIKPRRKGDPPELVADPTKAKKELDWKPVYSKLETILETAYNWHKKQ